jgi:hypothetical protein
VTRRIYDPIDPATVRKNFFVGLKPLQRNLLLWLDYAANKTSGGEKYFIVSESTRSEKVISSLFSIIELFIILHKRIKTSHKAKNQPALPCKGRIRSACPTGGCPERDFRLSPKGDMLTELLTQAPKRSNLPDQHFHLSPTGQVTYPEFAPPKIYSSIL